jgi:hypothetical protein
MRPAARPHTASEPRAAGASREISRPESHGCDAAGKCFETGDAIETCSPAVAIDEHLMPLTDNHRLYPYGDKGGGPAKR